MMLFWLLIWLLILIFNTVHSFLPTKLQGKKWIRVTAMIIATTILLRSGWQDISSYQSRTYLHITPDGKIDSQNNFPWDVSITSTPKGPAYLVSHRRALPSSKRIRHIFTQHTKQKMKRTPPGKRKSSSWAVVPTG